MTVIGEAYIDVKSKTDSFDEDTSSKVGSIAKKAAAIFAGAFVLDKGVEFFKGALEAGDEARKSMAQTEAVIKSTGDASHVTADHVDEMARRLSGLTGIQDETIKSSENMLLTFTNVRNEAGKGNDIFDQATVTVQNMATALGEDAKSASIQLGKALNDPVGGATALRRVGVQLTDQQKEQIKTFVASGDVLSAQKIILKELGTEFGGSAEAQATAGAKLKATFHNIQEEIGLRMLPAVDAVANMFSKVLPVAFDFMADVAHTFSDAWRTMVFAIDPKDGPFEEGSTLQRGAYNLGKIIGTLIDAWHTMVFAMSPSDGPFEEGSALQRGAYMLGKILADLRGGLLSLVNAFKIGDGDITSSGWHGWMEQLGYDMRVVWEVIEDHLKPILIALGVVVVAMVAPWAAIAAALIYAYTHFAIFRTVVADVVTVAGELIKVVLAIIDYIGNNLKDILIAIAIPLAAVGIAIGVNLVAGFVAWAIAAGAAAIATIAAAAPVIALGLAIAALVAGFIYAYTHFQLFHDIVLEVVRVLKDVFIVEVDAVVLVVKNFVDYVQLIWRVLKDVVTIVVDLFHGDWRGAWDAFKDIPMAVIDFVKNLFSNYADFFKGALGALIDAVTGMWSLLWDHTKGFFQGGIDWITDHWKLLLEGMVVILTGGLALIVALIVKHWDDIRGFFAAGIGAVVDLVTTLPVKMWNVFYSVTVKVVEALEALPSQLYDLALWWMTTLLSAVVYGAATLVKFFAIDLPKAILSGLVNAVTWLVDTGTDLITGIIHGAETGVPALAKWANHLPFAILDWMGDVVVLLAGQGMNLIDGIIRGAESFIPKLAAWANNLPRAIISWFGDVGGSMLGQGMAIIDGIIHGAESLFPKIAAFINQLPRNLLSWMGDVGGLIWSVGTKIVSSIIDGANSLIPALANFANNLPRAFLGWMGSIGGVLSGAGWDLMKGLASGIISAAESVFVGPLKAVGDAVIKPLQDVFGWHSPSTVFMGLGRDLMAGLAIGLGDTAPVENALGKLGSLTPDMAFSNIGGSSGFGSSAGSLSSSSKVFGAGAITVPIDLRGAVVTESAVAMIKDMVTEGVVSAFEAVDRKGGAI